MRNAGLVIGIVLLIVLLVLSIGGAGIMGFGMVPWMMGGYRMHGFGGGFGFPLWGGLMVLAFWGMLLGGITVAVVSLTRNSRPASTVTPSPTQVESPLAILKARYARGDITKEQLAEMKKDLKG